MTGKSMTTKSINAKAITNRKLRLAACLFASAVWPSLAVAQEGLQSAYGCRNLEQMRSLQALEGKDGFFFRIIAELRMEHPFTDGTMKRLAQFSQVLAEQGTTLIYVPIPSKSIVLNDKLPERAALFGYNDKIAREYYNDIFARFQKHGVTAVDISGALQSADKDFPPFFKTDFHWTAAGARLAAEEIAKAIQSQPEYADLGKIETKTVEKGVQVAFSGMRLLLQENCIDSLPQVVTPTYETTALENPEAALDILGEETASSVVLIGTSFSDMPVSNFGGFVQEYSKLPVLNYSLTGGNQFGSMISYVTSQEFQEKRPRYLIWENPIYNNLSEYGEAPWAELLAMAYNKCEPLERSAVSPDGLTISSKIDPSQWRAGAAILADAGLEGPRSVKLKLENANGRTRFANIQRNDRMRATGRFVFPLSPYGNQPINQISATFDIPAGDAGSLQICQTSQELLR